MKPIQITFGMIVLNGEPFLQYNLRALYAFAHQIIVVEGAAPDAGPFATADGHSTDHTLELLQAFKTKEDPEDKLIIVTAEDAGHPNGFWPGEKHEQSQAYAERAGGNYLWQVDVDEFYKPEDMQAIIQMLIDDTGITAVSFPMLTYWGGFDYLAQGWYLRRGGSTYHRLFKWGENYRYSTHRPPTVLDPQGRDTRKLNWVNSRSLEAKGIYLYHYSLLFPRQVEEKVTYYNNASWAKRAGAAEWMQNTFLTLRKPYRVHNVFTHPSWLSRFTGTHPSEIQVLRRDIDSGIHPIEMRPTEDIEHLLSSPVYKLGIIGLVLLDYPDRMRIRIIETLETLLKRPYRRIKALLEREN